MNYSEATLSEQKIIGISIRTDNSEAGKAKIKMLWQKFYQEKILEKIPDKVSDEIFAIYTNYEKDETKAYNFIIGAKVFDNSKAPIGMVSHTIPEQKYAIFDAFGTMPQALIKSWQEIWKAKIERKFSSDFEIHNEYSNQGDESEIEIYISVK